MKIRNILVAMALVAGAGCAVQGGNNIDPVGTAIVDFLFHSKTKVLDFDAKTYVDAAAACNAQAAKDYNAAMLICANPTAFVTAVNNGPQGLLVTTSEASLAVTVLTAKCTVDGFLPTLPATIQQTTCPAPAVAK